MSGSADAHTHHGGRVRSAWLVTATGPTLGVVLAIAVALLGGGGAAGLAVLLLGTALGCAAGSLHAGGFLLLDDVRGRPTSARRAWLALGLFVASVLLVPMTAAAAAAAAG